MFKQIEGKQVIDFIKLLGELRRIGLTSVQETALKEEMNLGQEEIDNILLNAGEAYETINKLSEEGYKFSGESVTDEELEEILETEDRMIRQVVFPSDSELGLDNYTEERNDLFNKLLVDDEVVIGESYGLYYQSLFSTIPFVAEGDIPSNS